MMPERTRPRLGPRPLPLHLALANLTWVSSRSALPFWRSGLPGWRPEAAEPLSQLAAELAQVEQPAFDAAVDREVRSRLDRLFAGIDAYRRHPYQRAPDDLPVLWREGTTRLVDYRSAALAPEAPLLLVVPSLINRAYILDLLPERSLLRELAARGFGPLLVDWDRPGEVERGFSLTDYIAGRLERALDAVLAASDRPVIVVGYCMGGNLALALAARRARDLAGLVCLATPWDFHADRASQARLIGATTVSFEPLLQSLGELPVDAIQALFAGVDPLQVVRKFVAFAGSEPDSPRARLFVAVEDWLNDGVPLAAAVARECLAEWYGSNTTGRGEWRIAGQPVEPAAVDLPSLVVIPDHDRIVSPASALPLAATLPRAHSLRPAAGHIGMVVGSSAEARLYAPLADWLHQHGAKAKRGGKRRAASRRPANGSPLSRKGGRDYVVSQTQKPPGKGVSR
jgi:polyhydroxyalkanoate synthase